MKDYYLTVTYDRPRTGELLIRTMGPIFGKKAVNKLYPILLRKRNILSVSAGFEEKAAVRLIKGGRE